MSMYGEDNIPKWKEAGLSNYEIYCIINKPPYDSAYCSRILSDTEKKLVDEWFEKGLNFSQISRLLNIRQLSLSEYLPNWGYKIEEGVWKKSLNGSCSVKKIDE